jgi:Polysaccharide pyruvyl transferase
MTDLSPAAPHAVLTPYLIPPSLQKKRVINVGDGFILRAVERRLGRAFAPEWCLTSREAPTAAQQRRFDDCAAVIVAGANQLTDRYTVWPGLSAERLRASNWVVVPFGVGIYGEDHQTQGMSEETRAILRLIHERTEFSSWRCPHTVDYLRTALPELADRCLMTGCPVVYDQPLLDGTSFHDGQASVAVTVTERGDFWARESQTLAFVAQQFPRARRYLVLHENFSPPSAFEAMRNRLPYVPGWPGRRRPRLRWYAASLGYQVIIPRSADEALAFYRGVDMHVGSRLHAHLHFLSQNKRSWVTGVDGRITGMAAFLGFPVCQAETLAAHQHFDFEIVRRNAQRSFQTMQRFVHSVQRIQRSPTWAPSP